MSRSVKTVKSILPYLAGLLAGGTIGALCVYVNVQNVKSDMGLVAFVSLLAAITLAVAALISINAVRALQLHKELAGTLLLMSGSLRVIGEANRRHNERLAKTALDAGIRQTDAMLTILMRLDERTRDFTTAERAEVIEAIENIAAVCSILDDWRGRAAQNEATPGFIGLESIAFDEPSAMLDLTADMLKALAEPQETREAITAPETQPLQAEPA